MPLEPSLHTQPALWVPTATEQQQAGVARKTAQAETQSLKARSSVGLLKAQGPPKLNQLQVAPMGCGHCHEAGIVARHRTLHPVALRTEMAEGSRWGKAAGCYQGLLWKSLKMAQKKGAWRTEAPRTCFGYLFVLNECSSLC